MVACSISSWPFATSLHVSDICTLETSEIMKPETDLHLLFIIT